MREMGGILGGGIGNGAGVGPTGFGPGEDVAEDETPNVEPEEQEQYDTFVKNGMEILYTDDDKVHPNVLERLARGKPREAMAQTTVWLVTMLETNAEAGGVQIEDDVVFHAGRELMEQLIDIAEAAGIHTFKEADIQGAWYQALDLYREANSGEGGRFRPEEAAAEFEALNEASKEGREDELIPGFSQMAERGIAMAMQDQTDPDAEDDEA